MQERKDQKRSKSVEGHARSGGGSKRLSTDVGPVAEKKSFLDITALIRSIQRAEDQDDCFRKGMPDCDQPGCKWRSFCLEG